MGLRRTSTRHGRPPSARRKGTSGYGRKPALFLARSPQSSSPPGRQPCHAREPDIPSSYSPGVASGAAGAAATGAGAGTAFAVFFARAVFMAGFFTGTVLRADRRASFAGARFGPPAAGRFTAALFTCGPALFTAGRTARFAAEPRAFFTGVFFAGALAGCWAAAFFARNSAQRFLVASAMRRRAAGLIRRFLGAGCFPAEAAAGAEAEPTPLRIAAHRFRCASAIRARPSALITPLRPPRVPTG